MDNQMDLWVCISVVGIAFFVGFGCAVVVLGLFKRIEDEICYLQEMRKEKREIEKAIAKLQREKDDDFAIERENHLSDDKK